MNRRTVPALLPTVLTALLISGAMTLVGASAAHAHGDCVAGTDTVVVLDATELDGEEQVLCAVDAVGLTGLDALTAAGLEYEETSAATMPFVCRIDGLPTPEDESCEASLDGEGYWAFLVATEGGEWQYAQTGLGEHQVGEDEFLALVYTPLTETGVPAVPAEATQATRDEAAQAHAAEESPGPSEVAEEENDTKTIGLVVGSLAVVLLVAVGFVVYRGRQEG